MIVSKTRSGSPSLSRSVLLAVFLTVGTLASSATAVGPAVATGRAQSTVEELARAVRAEITAEGLRRQVEAIVSHQRSSGGAGENAAIDHIVATLRAEGIEVEVHTFDAYVSDPVSASVEVVGSDIAPPSITAAYSASVEELEARVVDIGSISPTFDTASGERLARSGLAAETIAGELGRTGLPEQEVGRRQDELPDLNGAIALVDGTPYPDASWELQELGAVGAVFINPEERLNELIITTVWGTPSVRNAHRVPTLPVAQVSRSDGEAIREALGGSEGRMRLTTRVDQGWRPLRLAVARVMPPGPDAPFVLFGGHIDAWHYGATDEGASNAAMVEIARAFHRHRQRLRRGLVVAWWPGHSNGRYAGSAWFADHFFGELESRGIAYLNVDGIGQIDAKRFGASSTVSLASLARDVVAEQTGTEIRPGRPGRNSDQAFNGVGLPLLQFSHGRLREDGGYWWWHTPDDTIDKVDPQILKVDADLYVDALAELMAAPIPPIDLAAQVEAFGLQLERARGTAADAFDLGRASHLQQRLLEVSQSIMAKIAEGPSLEAFAARPIELEMVRVLRPLHRVLYTLAGPYHPDPAVSLGQLPGLAPLEVWVESELGSDARGFIETTLVRERNRLEAALRQSLERAEWLDAVLSGGRAGPR